MRATPCVHARQRQSLRNRMGHDQDIGPEDEAFELKINIDFMKLQIIKYLFPRFERNSPLNIKVALRQSWSCLVRLAFATDMLFFLCYSRLSFLYT